MDRQALIDASAQPGGRAPAPPGLALVQAFVNTVDREHGPDLLDEPGDWAAWCAARGLVPAPRDAARAVRETLRVLLWANAGHDGGDARPEVLDAAAQSARVRFDPPRVEAPAGDALATIAAQAFTAMADGTWPRLKACPGERCGWAYYDRSVNGSSAWCSMRVCGGRAKARAYYHRRTGR